MGMRIGSSASVGATQSPNVANWQQRQQSFKDLSSALQSGDLGAAQKAFAALTGSTSAASGASTASGTASVSGTPSTSGTGNSSSLLAQIGQALQNGDLSGAEQAMQALQASRGGHHHHHGGQQPAATASTSSSSTPVTASSGAGSLINTAA